MQEIKERFIENTKKYSDKISLHQTMSSVYLKNRTEPFDIAYIDGSHTSADTLVDAVQAHLLLNPGGVMIFDDYLWAGLMEAPDVPKSAINAFLTCFAEHYELRQMGYQVVLKKKVL